MPRNVTPLALKFWSKVEKTDSCWLWTASTKSGYGQIVLDGKMWLAHRASWAMAYGPIPADLCVLHKCDNRLCVRPDHLFLGSRAVNSADMVAKQRQRRGTGRPNAKLTEAIVAEARARFVVGGATIQQLADDYGVKPRTMLDAVSRRTWKHVTEPS